MTAEVVNEFTFKDIDRSLKNELLDYVDYQYRFRASIELTVEDVVDTELDYLQDRIEQFYGGLSGITFRIQGEEIVQYYRNTFME